MALLRIPPDVTGSRKYKMAVVKQEVLISQPLDKIATSGLTAAFFKNRLPVASGSIRNSAAELVDPENGAYYLVSELRYNYFRFNGRHLEFPTSGKSDSMADGDIDFHDPENMGV